MSQWFLQMGPLAWPLMICSLLSLFMIVERMLFFIVHRRLGKRLKQTAYEYCQHSQWHNPDSIKVPHTVRNALDVILSQPDNRARRDEQATIWLANCHEETMAYTRWMLLIALISPLLGLLGTVLGMIDAFQELAVHQGPVQPSLIADGVLQAMLTTAYGLVIAIPTLIAAHAFRILGNSYMTRLEQLLNHVSLTIDEPQPGTTQVTETNIALKGQVA